MHNGHLFLRSIKLMISTRRDRSPLLLFFYRFLLKAEEIENGERTVGSGQ